MPVDNKLIQELLKRPPDIAYGGDLPLFVTWALGPVFLTQGAAEIDQHKAGRLYAMLTKRFGQGGPESGWCVLRFNHWALGWVEHVCFRVINDDGTPASNLPFFVNRFYRRNSDT